MKMPSRLVPLGLLLVMTACSAEHVDNRGDAQEVNNPPMKTINLDLPKSPPNKTINLDLLVPPSRSLEFQAWKAALKQEDYEVAK
jgi:hypothetical protein